MTRTEALATILVQWAIIDLACCDDQDTLTTTILNKEMKPHLNNAIFLWFGTTLPAIGDKEEFQGKWKHTLTYIRMNFSDISFGNKTIYQVIMEAIVDPLKPL